MSQLVENHLVFPTRGRIEKAKITIASQDSKRVKTSIIADFDGKSAVEFSCMNTEKQVGSVMARNIILNKLKGNAIVGTDDIVFVPGAIDKVIDIFYEKFPDTDGVIGMRQGHPGHHPTGVVFVGDKFLNRYPNRWLYCPYYWHFACQEIMWHAEKVNRFYYTDFVCLNHYPPSRHKDGTDKTHTEARLFRERDKSIRNVRKSLKLIWGFNG
jgi:hypothetical protein